ncbi:MAG: MerR family transcriptional regulator [Alphaproteobacteria bacterium]|nr:MerR family transcriptional regulator [Alphaproteobacteria bacterium]
MAEPNPTRASKPLAKSASAFRTISEVSQALDVPQHVLRFWESKFSQIKPLKRGGGRRYYRPEDIDLLRNIRDLLYTEGYTIRGVQKLLKEGGIKSLGESLERSSHAKSSHSTDQQAPAGLSLKQRQTLEAALSELTALRSMLESS